MECLGDLPSEFHLSLLLQAVLAQRRVRAEGALKNASAQAAPYTDAMQKLQEKLQEVVKKREKSNKRLGSDILKGFELF